MLEVFLENTNLASAVDSSAWWRVFGRLHPLLLHFPIAMLIAAGLVELALSWRKQARPHAIASFCLWVGMFFCILSTWTGWEMADQEGIAGNPAKADLLEWHRWTGLVLAVLTILVCIAWLLERFLNNRQFFNTYRYGLWVSAALVCFVGHFGAEMKWGRDYLFSVVRTNHVQAVQTSASMPVTSSDDAAEATDIGKPVSITWTKQIKPLFESRCVHCHGPNSQKGGLQLLPYEAFREHMDLIDQSNPMRSLLVHRVVLPKTDPDAMPPSGERLTTSEIQTIADWIKEGAPGPADDVTEASASKSSDTMSPPISHASSLDDLTPSQFDVSGHQNAIKKIQAMGGYIAQISQQSHWLDVNLSLIRPPVSDEKIRILADLEKAIVWLDLGDSGVTDLGIEQTVSALDSLRTLRLDRTSIGDAGVSYLGGLHRLEKLNLFGTDVTDACVPTLEGLRSLKSVYVWDTKMTPEGIAQLRSLRPDLRIIDGVATSGVPSGNHPDANRGGSSP